MRQTVEIRYSIDIISDIEENNVWMLDGCESMSQCLTSRPPFPLVYISNFSLHFSPITPVMVTGAEDKDKGEDDTGQDEGTSFPINSRQIVAIVIVTYSIAWLCWFLYGYRKKLGPVYIMDLNIYAEWTLGNREFFYILPAKRLGL